MRIFLATLATPTEISDLYEFALNDLSELYETRAFASRDAAVEWAQAQIDTHNAGMEDEPEFCVQPAATFAEERPMGDPRAVEFVWWTTSGEMGTSEPSWAFCLRLWEQEIA